MSAHVYVESSCCAEEATRARLWLCSTVCPTALVLASPYEGEDDDFVVICTNRAVLDVGLLSLHDLRADSLIRPIASRSVIQLLSNHCHFNNHIFFCIFLLPSPRARSELQWQCKQAFLFILYLI